MGKNVCIVVMGDIGRSPRMQYHALSFANNGYNVDLVGYEGSTPLNALTSHSNINLIHFAAFNYKLPKQLEYFLKTIWTFFCLLYAMSCKRRSHYVLVQNPPAIPTLFVCWLYAFIVRAKFIIDWHNYAHTIMALNLKRNHPIVKVAETVEKVFGQTAHLNFCVTKAMKNDLMKNWGIRAEVLYDRPPDIFKPITLEEKHKFINRLANEYSIFGALNDSTKTAFTEMSSDGRITLRKDRPGFIVSSTSWTEDEDFSILLYALEAYDECVSKHEKNLPDLIVAITGKGPMKDHYVNRMENLHWKHIKIVTPWLRIEDYPLLLASADLGVCLHTSSSGLDLPMKVVDMFGCGLPVCAYNFKCLNELVKNEVNSYTFDSKEELIERIQIWFSNFPTSQKQTVIENKFKTELKKFQKLRWTENWDSVVLPSISNN